MKIQNMQIDKVIPYARNPRKNADAVSKVAASLKEYGWKQPIVVDSEFVVVAGHTRLAAARMLNMDSVPVLVASDLTQNQVKAYRLADNRVSEESEWDDDMLRLELQDLLNNDFDVDLTGFDDFEVKNILIEPNFAPGDESDQGTLDEAEPKMVTCPYCKTAWDLREHGQG